MIHIEYSQDDFDQGFFTAIITNGLKKCNAAIKVAKSFIDKAAEFFSLYYSGYTIATYMIIKFTITITVRITRDRA
jgi:hypothetical protein